MTISEKELAELAMYLDSYAVELANSSLKVSNKFIVEKPSLMCDLAMRASLTHFDIGITALCVLNLNVMKQPEEELFNDVLEHIKDSYAQAKNALTNPANTNKMSN